MNKLDKQFEEMMKGIKIDSPSSDFTFKVMSRIQAEAAVQRPHLLLDYKPVISKKAWIILIAAFILIMIYITVSGKDSSAAGDSSFWSTVSNSLNPLKSREVSSIWQKGMGVFSSIPPIAYMILLATLALWTLDSYLQQFRHNHSKA